MSNETLTEEQADHQPQERSQDQAVESPAEVTEEPAVEPEEVAEAPEELPEAPPTGPRGGTTTISASGLVKKNFWIPEEMAEGLRKAAYEERVSESDIMRRGLALALEELK